MSAVLFADDRESWFFEAEGVGEEAQRRRLNLGDFIVEVDGTPVVIMERKTIPDMWASIRDSRHREQLSRLRDARSAGVRVLYLVVGRLSEWAGDVERRSIRTALRNLMLRDGIPVWFFDTADECREAILDIAQRVSAHPEWLTDASSPGDLPKLSQLAPRRTASSPDAILEAMLASVPKISAKSARAILDHFSPDSMDALARAVKDRGLDGVRVGGRRMSEAATRSLRSALLGSGV